MNILNAAAKYWVICKPHFGEYRLKDWFDFVFVYSIPFIYKTIVYEQLDNNR